MRIYSLYSTAHKTFSPLFTADSDVTSMAIASASLLKPSSQPGQKYETLPHFDTYQLFSLGSFDSTTGKITTPLLNSKTLVLDFSESTADSLFEKTSTLFEVNTNEQ